MCRENAQSLPELRAVVDRAISGLDQSLGIIMALLRIAEIEHSRRFAGFGKVALADLVREVGDLYEPIAEDKHVAAGVRYLGVIAFRRLRGVPESTLREPFTEGRPIVDDFPLQIFPIVQARATEVIIVNSKPERPHEPQLRADRNALVFLAGYILFLPFIIWWDPYEPKWFLVPNIFLAAFLASSLAPWLGHKYVRVVIFGSVVAIAATNFITTIRPRHTKLGPDREMAQCVAEHMTSYDLFLSAQWGWSEYLPYLHNRSMVSLIYAKGGIDPGQGIIDSIYDTRQRGGSVYMADPYTYSQEHIDWLKAQTGFTRETLVTFAGAPAFSCNGVQVLRVRP